MNRPSVSIVLPIYNAGTLLEKTFQQLRELKYENVEIVIIDDASTDSSRRMIVDFEKSRDDVVSVLLEKNVGAAQARNLGLSAATGDFVWFVDWDDQWDSNILEALTSAAVAHSADIVTCVGMWHYSNQLRLGRTDGSKIKKIVSSQTAVDLLLSGEIRGYLWNKLFRRESFPPQPFPLISTQEDLVAIANLLPTIDLAVLLPDVLYRHEIRPGSLTNTKDPELENLDIAKEAVHRSVELAGTSPRRDRLLSFFDLSFVSMARANTAMRLSAPDVARAELSRFRKDVSWSHIVCASRISITVSVKAAGMKTLGPKYVSLRSFYSARRESWRNRRSVNFLK